MNNYIKSDAFVDKIVKYTVLVENKRSSAENIRSWRNIYGLELKIYAHQRKIYGPELKLYGPIFWKKYRLKIYGL